MARKLRLQYEGAIYHLMNRGDHREDIFHDDSDRALFLKTLGEACAKTDWQVHAYCLMRNHFHLVLETPRANLVPGMKWLLATQHAVNAQPWRPFGGRSQVGRVAAPGVIAESVGRLEKSGAGGVEVDVIAHGAQVAGAAAIDDEGFVASAEKVAEEFVAAVEARGVSEAGIPRDSPAGRREFRKRLELRRWEDNPQTWNTLRRGWCLGDEPFRKELLQAMEHQRAEHFSGVELRESDEQKAERIVREKLRKLRWTDRDLQTTPKGDPRKLKLAQHLRVHTTMTLKWISRRLHTGAWTHLNNRLYHAKV